MRLAVSHHQLASEGRHGTHSGLFWLSAPPGDGLELRRCPGASSLCLWAGVLLYRLLSRADALGLHGAALHVGQEIGESRVLRRRGDCAPPPPTSFSRGSPPRSLSLQFGSQPWSMDEPQNSKGRSGQNGRTVPSTDGEVHVPLEILTKSG